MEASTAHWTHRLHLFEHASASEATSETTTEKVVIVIEHAEPSKRIPAPLLLLTSPLTSSTSHAAKRIIIKKVLERVATAEESLENVVSLRKCEALMTTAATTTSPSETLEESRLATETASTAAATTLL